jgi:TonB family protein
LVPPVETAREGSYLQWVQSQADASTDAEPTQAAAAAPACPRHPIPPFPEGGLAQLASATGDGGFVGPPIERPKRVGGQPPVYTLEAMKQRVQGTFIAKCVITEQGDLTECCVVKGLPYMDEAVLAALKTWKYTPVMFQGQPARVNYTLTVHLLPPDPNKPAQPP